MLDPCEDDKDDMQDDEVSLGADSVQRDGASDSDTEVKGQHQFCFYKFDCIVLFS